MPAQPVAVQQAQGRIFTYPVPQGWRLVNETTNEILIAAPDSTQAIGFTGLERMQVGNSAQFLQRVAQMYGSQNLQILSGNRLPVPNCDAIEAIITYTSGGKPCKAWVRVAVVAQNGFGNGYMLMAIATPEKFDSVVAELKPLCDRIQITDASAAFDRANAAAAARPVYTSSAPSLNHP
ncbi:MAG TPA: hypothetical protein VLI90_09200, partial [Tepidisphaeraceae bacterium]|nr:hypothetical protein [Tepidisphaeraceae bacterium]